MSTFNDRDSLMIESGIDPDTYVSPMDDYSDLEDEFIYLTSDEWQKIKDFSYSVGFSSANEYIRSLIFHDIENFIKAKNES